MLCYKADPAAVFTSRRSHLWLAGCCGRIFKSHSLSCTVCFMCAICGIQRKNHKEYERNNKLLERKLTIEIRVKD